MLIHPQQLWKLHRAMQCVTYTYTAVSIGLEYYLTEDSLVICRGVQGKILGKIRKKKSTSWMLDDNACWMHTLSDGRIVKVMRLGRKRQRFGFKCLMMPLPHQSRLGWARGSLLSPGAACLFPGPNTPQLWPLITLTRGFFFHLLQSLVGSSQNKPPPLFSQQHIPTPL